MVETDSSAETKGYLERVIDGVKTLYGLNAYERGYNATKFEKYAPKMIQNLNPTYESYKRVVLPIISTYATLTTAEVAAMNYLPPVQEIFSNFPEDDFSRQVFGFGLMLTVLASLGAGVISSARAYQGFKDGVAAQEPLMKSPCSKERA